MTYHAIGLMSGSSLDGLDIAFVEFQEISNNWKYSILKAQCTEYDHFWLSQIKEAINLPAKNYQQLHADYGRFLGEKVNDFIKQNKLERLVSLVASHGHTTFHFPEKGMTHQLGDGAAIAAETQLAVVSDLRSLDVAFHGQGAPIVPLGEKLLFPEFRFFLNLGGIANISAHTPDHIIAFDVCPANRVLNMLANVQGHEYDEDGIMASFGQFNVDLYSELNALEYYRLPFPKSLSNDFGVDVIFPLIKIYGISIENALNTYVEHVAIQIKNSLNQFSQKESQDILITGGGAFNKFLIKRLSIHLNEINFKIVLPATEVIQYKEALIMAFLGVLRWREQYTISASVTGALRNSIGGALWLGNEAKSD